jgi:hypothetical protein
MKKIFFLLFVFVCPLILNAQDQGTARLKSASRLFAAKDDLTSVIMIIPADSVVTVIDSDSTYFHVSYDDSEGYIFKRQAVLEKEPVVASQNHQPMQQVQKSTDDDRFRYLENKYGTSMAGKLINGKIWKGMSADMVNDSWGTAQKINRVINGNTIRERWYFKNTWLYFENSVLLDWGAIRKE